MTDQAHIGMLLGVVQVDDDTLLLRDEETQYDCFDRDGKAQGCHAYAKTKVSRVRFLTGCSARGPLGDETGRISTQSH